MIVLGLDQSKGFKTTARVGMWIVLAVVLSYAICDVTPQVTERVGCFRDEYAFVLTGLIYRNKSGMTVDWCLNECLIQRGYVFAGLEAGYACLCGNDTDHTKHGPRLPDSDCKISNCAGNISQTCGGRYRLDIYRDYNECANHNGGCGIACVNTPLSYYCDCGNASETDECSCLDGFDPVDEGETLQCKDVNECFEDPDICSMDNFECINTPGSYRCECKPGYILNQSSCLDIDECILGDDECNQNCINTDGAYICSCMTGYEFVGEELHNCADKDECVDVNICSQVCTNLPGKYLCSCHDGYRPEDEHGANCTDVDECGEGSYQCDHTCINTPGLYQCTCELGYLIEQDLHTCTDKDECADDNTCDQMCTNLPGGYECSCHEGYHSEDKKGASCTDVDECTEGLHQCDHTCINTPGLYKCSCELGYHMEQDLHTCTGLIVGMVVMSLAFTTCLVVLVCVYIRLKRDDKTNQCTGTSIQDSPTVAPYYENVADNNPPEGSANYEELQRFHLEDSIYQTVTTSCLTP